MSSLPLEFEAGDTLETLIHQFTDPYTFLRELVQNSLDAGSTRVEVRTEFRPGEDREGPGIAVFTVEDTGEGMNREILDTRLTRLFSSSKEGDLTKIGKFGIGFVSVFALAPECVVVDTGRDGESWRLLFHPDHHFERIRQDHPVDGTRVQVLKSAHREEFERMRRRGLETVGYWCKHCLGQVLYDGASINQPFELPAPRALRQSLPGTEILVAPSAEERPFFGFYNRGLTLLEGHQELVPGVQFKLNSRYLEHTLTRDQVMQDENYEKAMALLRQAVDGPLREALFREAGPSGPDDLFGALVHRLEGLPLELEEKPLFPLLHGEALSISGLRSACARLAELPWDDVPSPASQELASQGQPVLRWEGPKRAPGLGALVSALVGRARPTRVREAWARVRCQVPPGSQALLDRLQRLLSAVGKPHAEVVGAHLADQGPWLQERLFLVQDGPETLCRAPRPGARRALGSGSVLVLNLDHPLVGRPLELEPTMPGLAAYLLAKGLLLEEGGSPALDARLLEAALS